MGEKNLKKPPTELMKIDSIAEFSGITNFINEWCKKQTQKRFGKEYKIYDVVEAKFVDVMSLQKIKCFILDFELLEDGNYSVIMQPIDLNNPLGEAEPNPFLKDLGLCLDFKMPLASVYKSTYYVKQDEFFLVTKRNKLNSIFSFRMPNIYSMPSKIMRLFSFGIINNLINFTKMNEGKNA